MWPYQYDLVEDLTRPAIHTYSYGIRRCIPFSSLLLLYLSYQILIPIQDSATDWLNCHESSLRVVHFTCMYSHRLGH